MAENSEPLRPWTHQNIQTWAREQFPVDFAALNELKNLSFREVDPSDTLVNVRSTEMKWPPNSVSLLKAGTYDTESDDEDDEVYVLVHGEERNQISYLVSKKDGTYKKLVVDFELPKVDFHEPYSFLGNEAYGAGTFHARFRALALYLFVASGMMRHIEPYRGFTREIRAACLWIKNKGKKPQASGVTNAKSENLQHSTSTLTNDNKDETPNRVKSKKRREPGKEEPPVSRKKQHLEPTVDGLRQYVSDVYTKLEEDLKAKDAEIETLKDRNATLLKDGDSKDEKLKELEIELQQAKVELDAANKEVQEAKLGKLKQMEKAEAALERALVAEGKLGAVKVEKE